VRFLILVFGFALGVGSTLVYSAFASPSQLPAPTPLETDPQLSVTIGEPLVAELIKRSVAEAPGLAVKPQIAVALRDDAIAVDASVDVLGRKASGTAILRPVIEGGKLRIQIASTNLGSLNLPPLEAMLEKQMNARINSLLSSMPVTFTGARVDAQRGLTVTCRVDVASLEVVLPR
jgi:uncharacterized protein YpmS